LDCRTTQSQGYSGSEEKVMKSVFVLRFVSAVVLGVLLFGAVFAIGQGIVTGSISGVVQDPQGAVVPGAKVTARHLATNREFTTQTTSDGGVMLRDLPTGAYNLRIESSNFRIYEATNVSVDVGKITSLGTVKLLLGSSQETVTVEGAAPLMETTTDQISETFSSEKVTTLPVGNTFDSLALFLPGVATAGDASFGNNNGAELSVNGLRARANNFQLDGQSNNDNSIGGPDIFFGNQDAIAEVQVVTNYDAEFGRNTGAVVNYVTKSGTNQFHGTGYEFWQGSLFDSLENQEKSPVFGFCPQGVSASTGCTEPTVPRFVDNRFGGSVGGPIKKDKIWFFGSSNIERQRFAGSPSSSAPGLVPTPNGVTQLQAAFPNSPIGLMQSTIGPNAITAGSPSFTNVQNVLVTDQIDPTTGLAFNCTVAGANGCTPIEFGQISRFVPSPFNNYEATGRVDFKLTNKDNFFARYIYQKDFSGGINFGNGIDVGDYQFVPSLSQQIGLDWARNFSNSFVNQVRFSFSRASVFFQEQSFPTCNSGSPTACPADMVLVGTAPQDSVSFGVAPGFPSGRIINVYQLQDNASMQKGRHTIKFGGELDQQRSPNVFLPENNGVFIFASFSDMIAANPFQTQIALGSPNLPFKEWDLGLYVQDDWRIKNNLTLNLGMRWDWYQQAINLLHDRSVAQQLGSEPLWSTSLPLSQTTVPSVPNRLRNFAPVFGFAWTPRIGGDDKTVVRGGFRMAYDPAFYNMFLNVGDSAPSVNLATLSGTGLPTTGFFGTQVIPFLQPQTPASDPGFANQAQVSPNFKNPYSEQWNVGFQRAFTSHIVGEVRYVGNHGVNLFQIQNSNPALTPLINAGFQNVIPAGLTPCATAGAPGFANGNVNCNFTNVLQFANTASSNYNGLQSELRIAGWRGVTATASYTYSKAIDNASEVYSSLGGGSTLSDEQNPFEIGGPERANSGTDFPHVVGVTVLYDVPFRKDQHGFAGHVLGGWQLSNTYRYTSGQPYTTIENYVNNPLFGTLTGDTSGTSLCDPAGDWGGRYDACRPILSNTSLPLNSVGQYCNGGPECLTAGGTNYALGTLINFTDPCFGGGCPVTPISGAHWIHNDPISAQVLGTPYAGAGRNTLRGQPISTANLAVFKNIKINERVSAQFQAQAFDVMNVQFRGVPDPLLDHVGSGSFQNTDFNANGGLTFAGNTTYDGIGRRRLLFGLKFIF
jgi:Carboxypeptidase regulatory-like domain/TonB dependent receptor/TonB-dependent Receptor Plug Domain